jgi:hypothetical protein
MTRKVYRTAQGKIVDLGALQLKNENIRAVGNMSVNARGDILNADNRPIDSRNNQVAKQYRRQTSNVSQDGVRSSNVGRVPTAPKQIDIPPPPENFDDDFVREDVEDVPESAPAPASSGGLAAAIARAREVTQEPLKPPRTVKRV